MIALDELLAMSEPPEEIDLSAADLRRLYWKFRGLLKDQERDRAYWAATNNNLTRAYEKLDEKERHLAQAYEIIREDLRVASRIQQSLLPSNASHPELDVAVYNRQLTDVGGDYFDFFRTRSGRTAIGLFDISGHGVSAALVMAFLKAQFTLALDHLEAPGAIVDAVNQRSYGFLREVKKYATVNFVVLEHDALTYAAGGGFGLVMHRGGVSIFEKRAPFLGLRQRGYPQYTLPFAEGDLLVMYTDGIPESQDAAGRDYTVRRLNDLIVAHGDESPSRILQRCIEDYEGFRHEVSDDVTLIIARRKA